MAPSFWAVTGADFARSISATKNLPNTITQQILSKCPKKSSAPTASQSTAN